MFKQTLYFKYVSFFVAAYLGLVTCKKRKDKKRKEQAYNIVPNYRNTKLRAFTNHVPQQNCLDAIPYIYILDTIILCKQPWVKLDLTLISYKINGDFPKDFTYTFGNTNEF